jgi:hypothetical protein
MKKSIFKLAIIALLIFPIMLNAQDSSVKKLFEKYSGKDGITVITINKSLFGLFSQIETDEENKEFKEAMEGIEGIKILAVEDSDFKGNFYDDIMVDLPVEEYEELMVIHEKDSDVKFLIKKKNGRISELLMIAGGKGDDNALICIFGDINMKTISKISKSMKINGLENLDKLEEENKE